MVSVVNTAQEAWEAAKEAKVDGFISMIAKAFPDAIDGVAVDFKGVTTWHMKSRALPKNKK